MRTKPPGQTQRRRVGAESFSPATPPTLVEIVRSSRSASSWMIDCEHGQQTSPGRAIPPASLWASPIAASDHSDSTSCG